MTHLSPWTPALLQVSAFSPFKTSQLLGSPRVRERGGGVSLRNPSGLGERAMPASSQTLALVWSQSCPVAGPRLPEVYSNWFYRPHLPGGRARHRFWREMPCCSSLGSQRECEKLGAQLRGVLKALQGAVSAVPGEGRPLEGPGSGTGLVGAQWRQMEWAGVFKAPCKQDTNAIVMMKCVACGHKRYRMIFTRLCRRPPKPVGGRKQIP